MKKILCLILIVINLPYIKAQNQIEEDQLGTWYMLFLNKSFENSQFGIQGDYQFRFWNGVNDLEQTLLRTGITYQPKNAKILFTLGYAHITSGSYGESRATSIENRIYQEALFPQTIGRRFLLTHRFRSEQRWVEDQSFRTRYRYNLFLNVPLNKPGLIANTLYLALYNEIFINGEKLVSEGQTVEFFDRNRTYVGLGYALKSNLRFQLGGMRQTTDNWAKNQGQISLHYNF